MQAELEKVDKSMKNEIGSSQSTKILNNFLDLAKEHKRSLLNDLELLKKSDGYENFRHQEAKALSNLVQKRLHYLQNPPDCSTARKLVCKINKGCGYGCQLHHIVYCFIMAYATERTLVLQSKGWRYHKGGWEEIFLPVSETCLDPEGVSQGAWPADHNVQVLTVPIIDSLNPRPPYLPLAIPKDLAPRLMKLHGDPIAWWIGQLLFYILKPQPETTSMLDNGRKTLGFKKVSGINLIL
jgi:glycoprotein 6-alpha-L-fucosyltransferase